MRKVTVGLIQFSSGEDKSKNVEKAIKLIKEAASKGAEIVCLPELFTTIYFPLEVDRKYFDLAETIPGPTTKKLCKVARELGLYVVAPMFEEENTGIFYNSAAIIGADGNLLGKYRKNHIPRTSWLDEKFYFSSGNLGWPVFKTPKANIGVMICYDRHFQESGRLLALHGADIIFVPVSFCNSQVVAFWELELQAHAISNLCFVGGVNRVGNEHGRVYLGRSFFADPRGQVAVKAKTPDREEVVLATLDLSLIRESREIWGFFRDRRPEIYKDLAYGMQYG